MYILVVVNAAICCLSVGATRAEQLEGISPRVDIDPLPFSHPPPPRLPLLLHPCFTHSLPYSYFLLPLNLARKSGARFTKYLTTILRLSYDNAKVTIDLRRSSNLQKHPTKNARFFLGTIHLQSSKIVRDSVRKLAYDIPKRNFSTF